MFSLPLTTSYKVLQTRLVKSTETSDETSFFIETNSVKPLKIRKPLQTLQFEIRHRIKCKKNLQTNKSNESTFYRVTHFSGTVLTYGIVFLSTNEPKPSRKFCVMFFILLAVDINITHHYTQYTLTASHTHTPTLHTV